MGNNKTEKEVLLDVQHLKKYFEVGKNQTLKAVDDVTHLHSSGQVMCLFFAHAFVYFHSVKGNGS